MAERRFMFVSKDEDKYPSRQILASEIYMSKAGDVSFYRTDSVSGRNSVFAAFSSETWEAVYEIDPDGKPTNAEMQQPPPRAGFRSG